MVSLAEKILSTIKDYRQEEGIQITIDDILEWATQFGSDAKFMLSEMAHILPKIYLSKKAAYKVIEGSLDYFCSILNYNDLESFLKDTEFLDMQREGKSQKALLSILEETIISKIGKSLSQYNNFPKKNFIYIDDVLASGNTIRKDLSIWLSQSDNLKKVNKGDYKLYLYCICIHTWGLGFLEYGLQCNFEGFKLNTVYNYRIENHARRPNQSFNLVVPIKDQPKEVKNYLASLNATKYEDYAYRDENKPYKEEFFSSPENRIKFENILLKSGLKIIDQIKGEVKPNVRPLGFTNPNYRIYGQGTLFITWRNIPNNCPLGLWWMVDSHDWKPLFPPKRISNG